MKRLLTLIVTDAMLSGRLNGFFRGFWASPLAFLFVLVPMLLIYKLIPEPGPKVGMSIAEFDAMCPAGKKGDDDFSSGPGKLLRTRVYSKDRKKDKCYGQFLFQDGKMTHSHK